MKSAHALLGALLAALVVSTACAGGGEATAAGDTEDPGVNPGDPTTTTTVLGTGDGTFSVTTEVFVDDSRDTSEAVAGRTLPTDIYLPGGEGPFPLVMHAHGMDGTSAKFSQLLGEWAAAGYVVVAPNFPRTNGDAEPELRDVGDYVNQPGDVTLVLDEVLAMNEPGGALAGLIATDHMGISGLSLGGATTYPLLFHPCCIDERYRSGILMSALELPYEGGDYDYTRRIPVLSYAGTDDAAIPYELQQETLAKVAGPLWNTTLPGGQHSQPFENNPSPQDQLVFDSTLEFWSMTLRDDPAAEERLVQSLSVDGLSEVMVVP